MSRVGGVRLGRTTMRQSQLIFRDYVFLGLAAALFVALLPRIYTFLGLLTGWLGVGSPLPPTPIL